MKSKHLTAILVALVPLSLLTSGYWFIRDFQKVDIPFSESPMRAPPHLSRSDDTVPLNTSRFLIYQCRNGQECGGLSDRQDGIVSAYVISQILGVRFGIDVNKPCPLSSYLVPNRVDWIIPPHTLKGKTKEYWTRIGRKHNYAELSFENITSKKTEDVIFYRGNINILDFLMKNPLYKKLPWAEGLSRFDAIKYIYNRIFKLSTATQSKFDSFMKSIGDDKLVCAHIRTGMKERLPFPSPHVPSVIDLLKQLVKDERAYTIFLATDSQDASSLFQKTFGSHLSSIAGPIIHVDQSKANYRCDGIEKAILDQMVLTYCDTLLMSRSGFSRTAALLRGTDDNLYEVVDHNVTKVMRMDPL